MSVIFNHLSAAPSASRPKDHFSNGWNYDRADEFPLSRQVKIGRIKHG